MDEFEFLEKMFNRLREVRCLESRAKQKTKPNDAAVFDCASISIECSIRDYLALRQKLRAMEDQR